MNLGRRGFLGVLASVMTGAVLDPDRLLWVPGQKTIFDLGAGAPELAKVVIADEYGIGYAFQPGDVVTFDGKFALHPVTGRPTEHLQRFQVTGVVSKKDGLAIRVMPEWDLKTGGATGQADARSSLLGHPTRPFSAKSLTNTERRRT